MNQAKIRNAKETHVDKLMSLKNVVSVGIGRKVVQGERTEEMGIVVGVTEKLLPSLLENLDLVPKVLDGIKTDVIQVGEIRALLPERTQRIRPAKGGYSIGNIKVSAGTFGCVVYRDSEPFILSNAHVFVPDPTRPDPTAREIVQPGIADGGRFPEDHIGNLEDYIIIHPYWRLSDCSTSQGIAWFLSGISRAFRRQTRFQAFALSEERNLVDAAICKPLEPELVEPEVEDIGVPTGVIEAEDGQPVVKSGRTTETTHATIVAVENEVTVGYAPILGIPTALARFKDQILIESPGGENRFSAPGDSGSIVFVDDGNKQVCGLLFAGNREGTYTYANRIKNVLQLLNVNVPPS